MPCGVGAGNRVTASVQHSEGSDKSIPVASLGALTNFVWQLRLLCVWFRSHFLSCPVLPFTGRGATCTWSEGRGVTLEVRLISQYLKWRPNVDGFQWAFVAAASTRLPMTVQAMKDLLYILRKPMHCTSRIEPQQHGISAQRRGMEGDSRMHCNRKNLIPSLAKAGLMHLL